MLPRGGANAPHDNSRYVARGGILTGVFFFVRRRLSEAVPRFLRTRLTNPVLQNALKILLRVFKTESVVQMTPTLSLEQTGFLSGNVFFLLVWCHTYCTCTVVYCEICCKINKSNAKKFLVFI